MKKSCETFLEADRLNLNKHFWSLGYSGRKSFILERVNRHTVQRRSISREVNKKNASLKYAFRRPDGSVHGNEKCPIQLVLLVATLMWEPEGGKPFRAPVAVLVQEPAAERRGRK